MASRNGAGRDNVEHGDNTMAFQRGNALRTSVSRLALTSAIGLLGLPALSTTTWAQCLPTGPTSITCFNANTNPQGAYLAPITVGTAPGFSIDTTGSGMTTALTIEADGALSYVDTNASVLRGGLHGLKMQSEGPSGVGSIAIQTNGNISGVNDYGISATLLSQFGSTAGGITITSTGTVTGGILAQTNSGANGGIQIDVATVNGNNGIFVTNSGGGATRVGATGLVSSDDFNGISVRNTVLGGVSAATDLTVDVASVIGARSGIDTVNEGTGATSITATGPVTGTGGDGIHAFNAVTAGNLTVNAQAVTGSTNGIYVDNKGQSPSALLTSIITSGLVEGTTGTGIYVQSRIGSAATAGSTSLVVNTAAVTGGTNGIDASNLGYGSTFIEASGAVVGTTGTGINAYSADLMLDIRTTSVTGGTTGIFARNDGSLITSITATGAIVGGSGTGIDVVGRGTDLVVDVKAVTGGTYGIDADNQGSGNSIVKAAGPVIGTAETGIRVFNAATAGNIMVEAAAVTAARNGIDVQNNGTGSTSVKATGAVVGGPSGTGISAANGTSTTGAGTSLKVEALNGVSGFNGISTRNYGSGATNIVAIGLVEGIGGGGIIAVNDAAAGGLFVSAENVSGSLAGILVINDGTGATDVIADNVQSSAGTAVTASGRGSRVNVDVASAVGEMSGIRVVNNGSGATRVISGQSVGRSGYGIDVINTASATDVTIISAGIATGDATSNGIRVLNNGTGTTLISTGALVEGGAAAISAFSAGQPIRIETGGLVRNLSQLSTSLAIEAGGGPIAFTNGGGLVGTVQFGAGAHTMANNAAWNTAGGANAFGGGQLTNAAGIAITAASNGAVVEATTFNDLALFINHGNLLMNDGGAGDITRQTGGNARFEAGSLLSIDINGAGQADRFITSGTATIDGSILVVNASGGIITYGTRYTVLTADGGVSGRFGSVSGLVNTAFLSVTDAYDANNVYLDVIKYRNFADAGITPNQTSTGRGLDSLAPGPLFDAVVSLATDAQARAAFDQLSGEVHASVSTALTEDSRFVRTSALDRLRSAFDAPGATRVPVMSYAPGGPSSVRLAPVERFAIWGQAFGSWGRWNGDGNAARLNRSTGGFTVGVDTPDFGTATMPVRVGLLAGYSNTNFNTANRSSSGSSDNIHMGAYAGTKWGAFGFRAGAMHSWHDIRTSRSVAFMGFNDTLRGSYDARTTQVFGDLGYRIDADRFSFEPFANLAYVNLRTNGFREMGGAAALTSQGRTTSVTFSTLGLRASSQFDLGGMALTARGTLGWRHAFGAVTPQATFAFAGGTPFAISGIAIARNAAVVEAGLDVQVTPMATIGISYSSQFARAANDQSLKGNFAVKF